MDKIMVGVTEYGEGMDVKLGYDQGRPVIVASNEAGYSGTFVDLIQVLDWVRVNKPELIQHEWVGLTGDEIENLPKDKTWWEIIRAAEAILKDKNNG